MDTTDERLSKLRGLKQNWDGCGADPPNSISFELLNRVLESMLHAVKGPMDFRLEPSSDGGLVVSRSSDGGGYAEIECGNDGKIFSTVVRAANESIAEMRRIKDDPESMDEAIRLIFAES